MSTLHARTLAILPLLALAGVAGRDAAAQGMACPRFDRTQVVVERALAPLEYDQSRSFAQLSAMPGRAPAPVGTSGGQVLGLAHARYGERSRIQAVFQRQMDGTICAAPSALHVTFGFEERKVFVARELPRDTCVYKEVLAHELKHVRVDELLLGRYLPIVEQRLTAAVNQVAQVRGARTQDQAMGVIRRSIDAELRRLLQEFGRERDRLQAQVDTVDEYRRVSTSCDGELSQYLPKGGQKR